MRAGFEVFRAFEQDAKDFAALAKTKLTMPMLVLTGEKASGEFLIEQGRLVADNVEGVDRQGLRPLADGRSAGSGHSEARGVPQPLSPSPPGSHPLVGYSAAPTRVSVRFGGRRRNAKAAAGGTMADGNIPALAGDPQGISEEALKKAEEFIEADEGALNRLSGTAGNVATTVAVVMSLFHLYAAIAGAWPFSDFPIISTQPLRYAHVAFVLVLSFLLFPMAMRFRHRIMWWDVVLGAASAPPS